MVQVLPVLVVVRLLEELVAVLEHLVNRGDNPEIVVRQASERFSGSITTLSFR